MSTRKQFLQRAAAVAVASYSPPAFAADFDPGNWSSVRDQFELDEGEANFATFLLSPHAKPVRDAIDRHRRGLDRDAKRYLDDHEAAAENGVRAAAAAYLGVHESEIALTDSTIMGLALVYGGLRLRPGQEVLTTAHDFYSTHESLRLRALRTGARIRKIRLYLNPRTVTADEVVSAVRRSVKPRTRVLALTWVHSSTGVKLPIRAIADSLRAVNRGRPRAERILGSSRVTAGRGDDAGRLPLVRAPLGASRGLRLSAAGRTCPGGCAHARAGGSSQGRPAGDQRSPDRHAGLDGPVVRSRLLQRRRSRSGRDRRASLREGADRRQRDTVCRPLRALRAEHPELRSGSRPRPWNDPRARLRPNRPNEAGRSHDGLTGFLQVAAKVMPIISAGFQPLLRGVPPS